MAAKSQDGSYPLQSHSVFPERRALWVNFSTPKTRLICPDKYCGRIQKGGSERLRQIPDITEGSFGETEYLVIVSRDLNYLPSESASSLLTEIKELSSMLHSLRKTIQNDAL